MTDLSNNDIKFIENLLQVIEKKYDEKPQNKMVGGYKIEIYASVENRKRIKSILKKINAQDKDR